MLKKEITYENPFTSEQVTETFYFHISKADIVRMEVMEHKEKFTAPDGTEYTGMQAKLQRIVHAEDGRAMMPVFEEIIRESFGRKDGDRFLRSPQIWEDFRASGAYDELLFELCTDAGASAAFVNGAMPANLEQLAKDVKTEVAATKKAAKKKAATKKSASQTPDPADADSRERALTEGLAAATPEEPIEIPQNELGLLDSDDLQTALASGRAKIGPPTN